MAHVWTYGCMIGCDFYVCSRSREACLMSECEQNVRDTKVPIRIDVLVLDKEHTSICINIRRAPPFPYALTVTEQAVPTGEDRPPDTEHRPRARPAVHTRPARDRTQRTRPHDRRYPDAISISIMRYRMGLGGVAEVCRVPGRSVHCRQLDHGGRCGARADARGLYYCAPRVLGSLTSAFIAVDSAYHSSVGSHQALVDTADQPRGACAAVHYHERTGASSMPSHWRIANCL